MEEEKSLEIQASSTTLGFDGDESGKIPAALGLVEGTISREAYTYLVLNNALDFKEKTLEKFPNADFGVSVLASSVNPHRLKELIRSIDYPYDIKWGLNFINQKKKEVSNMGYTGFAAAVSLGEELGYAMLQAKSAKGQIDSTIKTAQASGLEKIVIRTCSETVSTEEEIKKIREVNEKLVSQSHKVVWAIEPNKKVGDGTLPLFMELYSNISKRYPDLRFAIDLDLGGLPNENDNLLNILEKLDQNQNLPLFISLSGREKIEGSVRTHLPLGKNYEENKLLGEWLYIMQRRGKNIPSLLIETSPAQHDVLGDYAQFLSALKNGYRG